MASLFDTTRNFSLYCIPAAWLLAFLPHAYAARASKSFDIRLPRGYTQALEKDQTIDQNTKNLILRAEGAQNNGFENLPIFATAVLAGNLASLPNATLNALSAGYLASRVVYNWVYLNNTTEGMGHVRTVVFFAGLGQCFTLFVKAGNVLRGRGAANLL